MGRYLLLVKLAPNSVAPANQATSCSLAAAKAMPLSLGNSQGAAPQICAFSCLCFLSSDSLADVFSPNFVYRISIRSKPGLAQSPFRAAIKAGGPGLSFCRPRPLSSQPKPPSLILTLLT